MNNPGGRRNRRRRTMRFFGSIGIAIPIVIGMTGFLSEMRKPHPDAQVLLSYLAFMSTPLIIIGQVVYNRDREGRD